MSSNDDLPVILVSAADIAAASSMIVELMSESSSPPQTNGAGGHEVEEGPREAEEEQGGGLVWRLANKYYTASVRLQPCADQPARAVPPADVQAHLIYLSEDECADEAACARRAEAARARLARGAVRLVAARAAAPPAALAAWAGAARYELVPLLPARAPQPEPAGAARLREALHAHVWPGLVRRGAAPALDFAGGSSSESSSDGESWGAWRAAGAGGAGAGAGGAGAGGAGAGGAGAGGAGAGGAAQFAAALALVAGARAPAGLGDAARRLNAEQLVEMFCRALGDDPPRGDHGDQ